MAAFASPEAGRLLKQGLFGFEKESLRATPEGKLALSPHPEEFGDKLKNANITVDFSESQMELITDPQSSIQAAQKQLIDLHTEAWKVLKSSDKNTPQTTESIWPLSMPCRLPDVSQIPIAKYDGSEEGNKREKYREGLALRYGKPMQMLCGVHFNFSFTDEFWRHFYFLHQEKVDPSPQHIQEFKNEQYLKLVRNFIRYRWILVRLCSSSPYFDAQSYQCPGIPRKKSKAVSLRLSRCGYSNPAEILMDYNQFKDHLKDYQTAVSTPHPKYSAFEERQLNDHLLQIPNEYYFPIRLKPKAHEDILEGLKETGVEYIEVRLFDVNPYEYSGINLEQYQFVHLFLIYCLFKESLPITEEEIRHFNDKQAELALNGDDLSKEDQTMGQSILKDMEPLAELLGGEHLEVLTHFSKAWGSPESLPWKRIKNEMKEEELNHIEFGIKWMNTHSKTNSQ